MIKISHLIDMLDRDDLFLYLRYDICMDSTIDKCALLFTHYLGRTGAPSMLFTMSKVLLSKGYQVFVVSPNDGEMREEFNELGANVIIYPDFLNDTDWLNTIANTFDFILVNTLVCAPVINVLAPLCTRIYWWIHEFEPNFIGFYSYYKNVSITPSLHIWAASLRIQQNIKKYLHLDSELLNFYIEDVPNVSPMPRQSKINFMQVGLIHEYKGQLVFLDAIKQLPLDVKNKCHFTFCGDFDSADSTILMKLYEMSKTDASISIIPSMPREELLHYYDSVDVIVIPSYEESTSAIAVEGLMKSKICICSSGCGVCDFLHDGVDSFFFDSGDSTMLSEKISYVVNHFDNFAALKIAARKVYETYYSENVFSNRITELCTSDDIASHIPNLCSGCNACYEICPLKCISIEQDLKGFSYPKIDNTKCTSCGLCKKVCPVNTPVDSKPIAIAYGLKLISEDKRKESQSGGAFTAFAEYILLNKGVVYGVGLTDDLIATYMRIDNFDNLSLLKGSKYVQASLNHIFPLVEEDLINHKAVFFSGTPCHIAGLYNYLDCHHINYQELLYTCDLICHGVPSPKLYSDYLTYLNETYGTISCFTFRDKSIYGWHTHVESFQLPSHKKYSDTMYTSLFYTNYFLRESCYNCSYAHSDRITDITIGDFWGVERQNDEEDDNLGVSLVMLHTDKGNTLFENTKNVFHFFDANKDFYQQQNLSAPTSRPGNVDAVWHEYLTFGLKYICQSYGSNYNNSSVTKDPLRIWKEKLNRGENFASYLKNKNINSVILCGNMALNKLLIHEFITFDLSVSFLLDIYNEEVMPQIDNVPIKKITSLNSSDIAQSDHILITDETHFSSIIEILSAQNVSPTQMIPFSFLSSEEI